MFKYSLQTRIIIVVVFIAVVIAMILAVRNHNSHSRDLALVNQVRVLGNSLEKYYDKFHAYPASDQILLTDLKYITENGVNQSGDDFYFKNKYGWDRQVVYSSNGKNYKIEFMLDNSWPLWGLPDGSGICQMTYAMEMQCASDQ